MDFMDDLTNTEKIPEKFLPIGSIVLLKGAKKKMMITGFTVVSTEEPDKIFDYCGYIYPNGIVFSGVASKFNHDQIEQVFYIGYSDDEDKAFRAELNKYFK